MRCILCQKLNIEALVGLAETEFSSTRVPAKAFFRHHPSIDELEASANGGCDLCQLIQRGLAETTMTAEVDQDSGYRWTMLDHARSLVNRLDFRIWITTDHVDYTITFSGVKMLEVLNVLPGWNPPQDDGSPLSDVEDEPLRAVKFVLTSPPGQPVYLGRRRIGCDEVNRDLQSESNFAIARVWITQCSKDHAGTCGNATDAPILPTRVIDVGDQTNAPSVKVFVSQGTRAQYVALSHCWGGPIATVLTTDNLQTFSTGLPRASLPRNFQDAIDITQKLGVRYLWIDSLCILQNSATDWAQESEKMADVYRNALVTICAMASPGSAHGILHHRPLSPGTHQGGVQIPVSGTGTRTDTVTARIYKPQDDDESLFDLDRTAPLSLRAWCMQESVLPRRILYFGASQIYWGCGQGFKAANGIPGPELFPRHGSGPISLASALLDAEQQQQPLPFRGARLDDILRRYYSLVTAYTRRRLTFDTDKLPAMSGLAQRVHPMVGGDYAAGLWTGDFKQGLLWSLAVGQQQTAKPVPVFRAPSWSWAATNEPVQFEFPFSSAKGSSSGSAPHHPEDLELLAHEIVLKDSSIKYGQVAAGHILVRGRTARLRQVHGAAFDEENSGDLIRANVYFDEPEWRGWRTDRDCYLDRADASDVHFLVFGDKATTGGAMAQRDYLVLLVRRYTLDREEAFEDEDCARGQCLILDGGPPGGDYRRVGLIEIVYWDEDLSAVRWEERTLKIV